MAELAVVLPTYNEADNLGPVVQELERLELDLHLLIVDDNSQDGTKQVARELSLTFGNVTVIDRPGKMGLGSALRLGLHEALATDVRYVVTMDADRSHDPQDLPRLLDVIRNGAADLVQGSRYVNGGAIRGLALSRRVSSRAANLLYHWCAGTPHDSTTNFRAFSRRAASLVVDRARGRDFEFMPEVVFLVLAAGRPASAQYLSSGGAPPGGSAPFSVALAPQLPGTLWLSATGAGHGLGCCQA